MCAPEPPNNPALRDQSPRENSGVNLMVKKAITPHTPAIEVISRLWLIVIIVSRKAPASDQDVLLKPGG